MAGTIFSLGMQQRVDLNGKPEVGWFLYIYAANSSTPVNSYADDALTILNPWPLEADANGMMPPFWLVDGHYRVRGTSNDGMRTFFDIPSIAAVGPSSTGTSVSVDPTAIFQTGDSLFIQVDGTRPGWVRDNGRTIGSAASGATEHANADCQNLFVFYWNTYPDYRCPVIGGRGASGLADWLTNKQIGTVDLRGVSGIGLDTMGNTAAGRFAGIPFPTGNATTAGSTCGENVHTLIGTEMPAHQHNAYIYDPGHSHSYNQANSSGNQKPAQPGTAPFDQLIGNSTGIAGTGVGVGSAPGAADNLTAFAGGGGAHNNIHYSVLGTWYRKI